MLLLLLLLYCFKASRHFYTLNEYEYNDYDICAVKPFCKVAIVVKTISQNRSHKQLIIFYVFVVGVFWNYYFIYIFHNFNSCGSDVIVGLISVCFLVLFYSYTVYALWSEIDRIVVVWLSLERLCNWYMCVACTFNLNELYHAYESQLSRNTWITSHLTNYKNLRPTKKYFINLRDISALASFHCAIAYTLAVR